MKYVAKQDLSVFDLHVKYANGFSYQLKLSKGQVLPEELVDSGDLKKSLTIGGLRNLIKMGFIVEADDSKVDEVVELINSVMRPSEVETAKISPKAQDTKPQAQTYKSIETISQQEFAEKRDNTGMVNNIDMTKNTKSIDVNAMEFNSVVAEKSGGLVVTSAENKHDDPADVAHEENGKAHNVNLNDYKTAVDFATIKTYDDFNKLNHFDQLLYVKQCGSKDLLSTIMDKTSKKQIQNNARKRAEELK